MPKKYVYNPHVFNAKDLQQAKNIILTPESGQDTDERWEVETPLIVDQLIHHLGVKPTDTVLDFGCGVGRVAKALIEKCDCEVVGVDISYEMLFLARAYTNSPRFVGCSPESFRFMIRQGVKFDKILAVWVLQHCLNLAEEIKQLSQALKDGGKLYVVNSRSRCVPTNHGFVNDQLDTLELLNQYFLPIESLHVPRHSKNKDLDAQFTKTCFCIIFQKK